MSSYVWYMFKYLFQPDKLQAELASQEPAGSSAAPVERGAKTAGAPAPSWPPADKQLQLPPQQMPINKSTIGEWLWQTITASGDVDAAQMSANQQQQQLKAQASLWPSKCREMGGALAGALASAGQPPRLATFADFERLIRGQQRRLLLANATGPEANWSRAAAAAAAADDEQLAASPIAQLHLLECYNQLQLADYYQGYDIFVGLRIASSLSILFVVFILFVIYKTSCRDEGSQLRLISSSGGGGGGGSTVTSSSSSATLATHLVSSASKERRRRTRRARKQQHCKHKPAHLSPADSWRGRPAGAEATESAGPGG